MELELAAAEVGQLRRSERDAEQHAQALAIALLAVHRRLLDCGEQPVGSSSPSLVRAKFRVPSGFEQLAVPWQNPTGGWTPERLLVLVPTVCCANVRTRAAT